MPACKASVRDSRPVAGYGFGCATLPSSARTEFVQDTAQSVLQAPEWEGISTRRSYGSFSRRALHSLTRSLTFRCGDVSKVGVWMRGHQKKAASV